MNHLNSVYLSKRKFNYDSKIILYDKKQNLGKNYFSMRM